MPKTFMIWEKVKTIHLPGYTDATDIYGVVDRFEDWWVMVLMSKIGVVYPFMEWVLEHPHDHFWIDIAICVFVPALAYCFWELTRRP